MSGTFKAVCKQSANGESIRASARRKKTLTAKEQFAYEMYLNQFNGDDLKAKKFLYMSRASVR
jgi:hypothetical protein